MRLERNLLYSDLRERGHCMPHRYRGRHQGSQEAENKSTGYDIYLGFPGKGKTGQNNSLGLASLIPPGFGL